MILLALASVLFARPALSQDPITFDAAFAPETIGPGSFSTLEFAISNSSPGAVANVAFENSFPASVTIADPASVVSDCGGVVDAPSGGSLLTLNGAGIGAGQSCSLVVNVTGSTPGTHTNVSGSLTSDLGNHGTATADLVVAIDRPGFVKAFSPASVQFGGRSTMTLTIDNTANSAGAGNLVFTDELPSGMVVADPANLANTCGGTLSAPAGGTSVSLAGFFPQLATVAAGASCTVALDVIGDSVGMLANVTGELASAPLIGGSQRSSGKAGAVLTVNSDRIVLEKSFVDDPTPPGETVTLRFRVRNLDRGETATAVSFTDDLEGALTGLAAIATPVADPCGAGSSLSGTGVLSFTGGTLPASGICTFDVTIQVPAGASAGSYPSATSDVTAELAGQPIVTAGASDLLVVAPVPRLAAEFTDDPVGGGGAVTLEYTLTNTSIVEGAGELAFTDELDVIFEAASSLPAGGFCGGSSTFSFVPLTAFAPPTISVSGASLAPGASCTFSVVLDIAVGTQGGFYTNTTSELAGVVAGNAVTGAAASATLEVIDGPELLKAFTDDPVAPGGTATLEFSISHDEFAPADATDIEFSDDLDAVFGGLVAVDTPISDICGAGSEITGASLLSLTGGNLAPGETCTFQVALQVPATVLPGTYANTTSNLVSTVAGSPVIGNAAVDELLIAGLTLEKAFVDDPVLPGSNVTLRFTIENLNPVEPAAGIVFFDDLEDVVPGLSATSLPAADVCGAGSSLGGTGLLELQNGSLAGGSSCSFDVTLQVPAATADGEYINVTSGFSGAFAGSPVAFDNATDTLTVQSNLLALTKEFIDDPAAPGDTVTLRFEITNLGDAGPITGIGFTDDLEAALSGLESIDPSRSDICGSGSTIGGTSLLTFSGGSLAGNASCSFDVTLLVPSTAPFGAEALNITSQVTGDFDGIPVDGPAATDVLEVDSVVFTKSFDGPAQAGDTVTLTFSIQNLDPTDPVNGMKFFDDLSAMLPGLIVTGLPIADVCGAGSLLEAQNGDALIAFSDGNLLPAGSCSFAVTLSVPPSVSPGSYLNVSSDLTSNGELLSEPAVDSLVIEGAVDSDGDGVIDGLDVCPATVIPEGVPTIRLGIHRFALVDGDGVFDTMTPPRGGIANFIGKARAPNVSFTIEDTAGCSCEQIIEAQDLGQGHTKFGCSIGAMREWIELVQP